MRTTVELPNELMKKAKMKAIEEGITFKEFLKKSIEKELIGEKAESSKPWKALRGSGDLKNYQPGDSAFDEDWMPESEFFNVVKDSSSDNQKK